jgi:hypothetical protein
VLTASGREESRDGEDKRRGGDDAEPRIWRRGVISDEPLREVDLDPRDSYGVLIACCSEHRFEHESAFFEQRRPFLDLRRLALVADDDNVPR